MSPPWSPDDHTHTPSCDELLVLRRGAHTLLKDTVIQWTTFLYKYEREREREGTGKDSHIYASLSSSLTPWHTRASAYFKDKRAICYIAFHRINSNQILYEKSNEE